MTIRIGDYELIEPLRSGNAGQSKYGFGRRSGREYFIKEFLSPRYLDDRAPGTEAIKRESRAACEAFEAHHRDIMVALRDAVGPGGNLVVPTDFFRHGAKYYKVTEKIEVDGGYTVHELEPRDRLSTMTMVTQSLRILHRAGLVHGDLKAENILVEAGARPRTKLIDFDDCVRSGQPLPNTDEMVGDPRFYSPEMLHLLNGHEDVDRITTASDIFALGLMFYEYETGEKAVVGGGHNYPSEASLAGDTIRPARPLESETLDQLIQGMLAVNPNDRPDATQVANDLKHIRDNRSGPPPWVASKGLSADPPPTTPPRSPGLRGPMAPSSREAEPPPPRPSPPALKGDLASRSRDTGSGSTTRPSGSETTGSDDETSAAASRPRLRGTLIAGGLDREAPPPVTTPPERALAIEDDHSSEERSSGSEETIDLTDSTSDEIHLDSRDSDVIDLEAAERADAEGAPETTSPDK